MRMSKRFWLLLSWLLGRRSRSVDEVLASINAGAETAGPATLRKELGIASCTCPPDKREPAMISRHGGGFVVPGTTTKTVGMFGCARCRRAMFLDQVPRGFDHKLIPDRYDVIER